MGERTEGRERESGGRKQKESERGKWGEAHGRGVKGKDAVLRREIGRC